MPGSYPPHQPDDAISALHADMVRQRYVADRGLATVAHVAMEMGLPLLLEGDPGVGKTELAKVLAAVRDVPLIRLQCYEGIDLANALYEWDYARQLLHVRSREAEGVAGGLEGELYDQRFLLERPLLRALRMAPDAVLLIDEVDRADHEFEAFLLEVLSEFQVTIPEHGTVRATSPPVVVLTSNRTRALHDALRRRCMYHWIDHPSVDREARIVRLRAEEVPAGLARQTAETVAWLRTLELFKPPGVAETIAWARVMTLLGVTAMDADVATATVGAVIKDADDLHRVTGELVARLGG